MLPTGLTESWRGQRVRIQDVMVIVVNAFVVKSVHNAIRFMLCIHHQDCKFIQRERERGMGKAQSPKVN